MRVLLAFLACISFWLGVMGSLDAALGYKLILVVVSDVVDQDEARLVLPSSRLWSVCRNELLSGSVR